MAFQQKHPHVFPKGCSVHWCFLGTDAARTWRNGAGGWWVESPALIRGEGGLQLEGPAKAVSEKELQGSGHLGLTRLPRKATSNTSNACDTISPVLRAQLAFSYFSPQSCKLSVIMIPWYWQSSKMAPRSLFPGVPTLCNPWDCECDGFHSPD